MKANLLTTTLLSLSLFTVSISAETHITCKDGKCFIDVSKLSSTKNTTKFKNNSLNKDAEVKKDVISSTDNVEPYLSYQDENGIETIEFLHEKYVMTALEIEEYELEGIELIMPNESIENRIINKTEVLPQSDHYCEDNSKPVYQTETDSFECA